jgi:predicted metal-binding protein
MPYLALVTALRESTKAGYLFVNLTEAHQELCSFEKRLVPRYAGRRDVNNSGLILVQAGLPAHPHTIQHGQ